MLEGNSLLILIMVCLFILMVILIVSAANWMFSGHGTVDRRLREIQSLAPAAQKKKEQPENDGPFTVKWLKPVADLVVPDDKWKQSRTRASLVRSGFRGEQAVSVFYLSKLLLAILLPVIAVVPFAIDPTLVSERYWIVVSLVAAGVIGFFAPDIYIRHKEEVRRQHLSEVFPDVLDLLVVCIEAGLSLDAAIKRVGEEFRHTSEAMSDELLLATLEIRAGKARNEAMKALAERTDLDEMQSLVSILIQAEHFGTSIADALRAHADDMRDLRIQTAREKAAKLPVKMAIPILLFIFPALFLVILGPAAIQIYTGFVDGM
ncbi:type II secretion system F family protein [Alcanivorax sediminis]|uniref:Type II secretion system F family protein n=1 Tax=Alcanivorax sediminis TaxID=2663008 RepID=A0A6N7LV84_9GAMM|nr:type II secretion system F family protein [Alcanivorax sediminis]MQX52985.1 type II secretion system F family protein [Alcanivorax sediminis]